MIQKIGIDVGGVLRRHLTSEELDLYDSAPPHDGALEFVTWVVKRFGRENVFIVSKIPDDKEHEILAWLKAYGFLSEKGLNTSNIFFCRTRADKAPIVHDLGVDYFIDDRAEVLSYMKGMVSRRVQLCIGSVADVPDDDDIVVKYSWSDVRQDVEKAQNG